jgi:hypothetical protein
LYIALKLKNKFGFSLQICLQHNILIKLHMYIITHRYTYIQCRPG